eukprot:TRINITY_DN3529_c0_g1_i10.p1 TRINITY_DN3529_c0_g1~~TRINITY_DN3529_c0_g1_i10.p1  ORF type:complete len:1190 (-),score=231.81 TRINITY_DN3529_c0_g1_i10:273-3842(-)
MPTPPDGRTQPLLSRQSPQPHTENGPQMASPEFTNDLTNHPFRRIQVGDLKNRTLFPDNRISTTKYSPLTFLPKNLLEQFSRHINRYFLLIACLQLWSTITPVDPITTWFPLIVIFLITACKEGYDDLLRWRRDCKENSLKVGVWRVNGWEELVSQEIYVGDLVMIHPGQKVPCDLVLLAAEGGRCFVSTANLDGESDLKTRLVPPEVLSNYKSREALTNAQDSFVVECEHPNPTLYQFDSKMWVGKDASLDPSVAIGLTSVNLLLQGCMLRGEHSVVGAAVYTGQQTKLGMNSKLPPVKLTQTDIMINKISITIFIGQLVIVVGFGIAGTVWQSQTGEGLWYLEFDGDSVIHEWWWFIVIPLRFLLLCSFMIPISLKVTLDFCKMAYAYFVEKDLQLYDAINNIPATANNSAIGEELGQVSHILTDKTGTLTQNLMAFSHCFIPWHPPAQTTANRWGPSPNPNPNQWGATLSSSREDSATVQQQILSHPHGAAGLFARCLALCHDLSVTEDGSTYFGASPDEVVLTHWAADSADVKYCGTRDNCRVLDVCGEAEEYELLALLEFDSFRKCMSVLVRGSGGQCFLYTKGADEAVTLLLAESDDRINQEAEMLAARGLRTLMLASKAVTEHEVEEWLTAHHLASTTTGATRGDALREVYASMETGLEFRGLTGISDSLQDQVPQTISMLTHAGIKLWVLTGDKMSTAAQIAQTCRIVPKTREPHQLMLYLEGGQLSVEERGCGETRAHQSALDLVNQCASIIQDHVTLFNQHMAEVFMILDGPSLDLVMTVDQWTGVALHASIKCVVCSRVTPKQKADVVRMVKDEGSITLAIGDGGNDVPMIQEAHVGVGIVGREGLQASAAADYSIGQFRFVSRLVLVHGHWAYHRTCLLAQYAFYKSIFLALFQLLFAFQSACSGSSWFNTYALTGYNSVFTALPPVFLFLDRNIPSDQLMRRRGTGAELSSGGGVHPYKLGIRSELMNPSTCIRWLLRALGQAVAIGLIFQLGEHQFANHTGQLPGSETVSMSGYSAIILIQISTVLLESCTLTYVNHIVILGSLVLFISTAFIMSAIVRMSMYGMMPWLLDSGASWLYVILVTIGTCATLVAPTGFKLIFERADTLLSSLLPNPLQLLVDQDEPPAKKHMTLVPNTRRNLDCDQVSETSYEQSSSGTPAPDCPLPTTELKHVVDI